MVNRITSGGIYCRIFSDNNNMTTQYQVLSSFVGILHNKLRKLKRHKHKIVYRHFNANSNNYGYFHEIDMIRINADIYYTKILLYEAINTLHEVRNKNLLDNVIIK